MPPVKTPARPVLNPVSASELGQRLSTLGDGLAGLQSDAPCPWPLGLVYNTLLRMAKTELGPDPVVRGLRALVESRSESGTQVADQSIGTVRALILQIAVAVESHTASEFAEIGGSEGVRG